MKRIENLGGSTGIQRDSVETNETEVGDGNGDVMPEECFRIKRFTSQT